MLKELGFGIKVPELSKENPDTRSNICTRLHSWAAQRVTQLNRVNIAARTKNMLEAKIKERCYEENNRD